MLSIGLLVLLLALTTIDAQNECSDRNANCIKMRNCPAVIEILGGPETLEILENFQCGIEDNEPMVCCSNQTMTKISDLETSPAPPIVTEHPNLRLLDHQTCGPINQQKVIGGNRTGVFQYPWMALITYDVGKRDPDEFRCGGTIISSRYILTSAHCVTSLPAGFRLIGARVGDHDISNERDCDKDAQGLEIRCAERYQDFGVENFYYHPEYTTTERQNDIALIRLNGSVDFRPDNVRPICLPFGVTATINTTKPIVTGWGLTELGRLGLLQAKRPLMPYERCKKMYNRTHQIWHKQLCARGQSDVDLCFFICSGGSLQAPGIYNDGSVRMVQHGVVSYGVEYCNFAGFPEVYTRISYYMDWILNTMAD